MGWLLHTILGGGVVLLACWLALRWVAGPARRQRLAEWGVLAALLLSVLSLGPSWLNLPICHLQETQSSDEATGPSAAPAQHEPPLQPPIEGDNALVFIRPEDVPEEPVPEAAVPGLPEQAQDTPMSALEPSVSWAQWLTAGLLGCYGVGVALLLGRWLLGHIGLRRLLRHAEAAPPAATALFEAMARSRRPRLLMSRQVRVPFSCGLLRPVVVVPASLCQGSPSPQLRWVFAHELTHLERRDAWAGLLFGLGQVLYFCLPWFWWLRRQARLCQEYLADAAAARTAGPVAYAQFLVGWTKAPAAPLGCSGVSGSSSDLYRRINMLLNNRAPLEARCPRRWSLLAAVGLLSVAVVLAGVGLGVRAAPAGDEETKKAEPKKEEPRNEQPRQEKEPVDPFVPQIEEILKGLPGNIDAEQLRHIQQLLAQRNKEMQKALSGMRQPNPFGIQVLGREPRLGARVAKPAPALADQLDLPHDQGLVVEEVTPNSPAEKAGLKPHDILLELNGKPVPSNVEQFLRQLDEIKAGTATEALVLRKGRKETVKGIKLGEAHAAEANPDLGFFPPAVGLLRNVPQGGLNLNLGGAMMPNFGANGVMTTTFRSGDRFITRHQEGSLVITVTGKVAEGKASLGEIRVQDGSESHKYDSVDKVPESYRDKVKNLVEMSEKGAVKVEIK
jgi:beta-lactamase regulating signal transducer with metallopeptidase domain